MLVTITGIFSPVGDIDQSRWWVSLTSSKPSRGCVSVGVIPRAGYVHVEEDGNLDTFGRETK